MTTAAQRPAAIQALLAPAFHEPQEMTMSDRYRNAWRSARQRAAVLSAEVTRRAPLLGEYAAENTKLHRWHDEDRTVLTEMRATIERLRKERDGFRDQRNAVFADNEKLLARMEEAGQARLRAENDARTAKREPAAVPSAPADADRRDRLGAVLTERFTEDNPFSRMTDEEETDEGWVTVDVTPDKVVEVLQELLEDEPSTPADAVLAVLPAPADRAGAPVVWTMSCEDNSVYGSYADETTAKLAVIEYYEENEERCPDYGWRKTADGLELLADGEPACIYLAGQPVQGTPGPAPADRPAVLREAANCLAALGPLDSLVSAPAAWTEAIETLRRMADQIAEDELRRMANETQQAEDEGLSGPYDCGEGAVHYTAAEGPAARRRMADKAQQAEPEPTQLRWGLHDVMWTIAGRATVMLSGPAGEPYWLELDPERAALLRRDLAGPGTDEAQRAEEGR